MVGCPFTEGRVTINFHFNSMAAKVAVLLASHKLSEEVIERFSEIRESPKYDFFILYHTNEKCNNKISNSFIYPFSDSILVNLGYQSLTNSVLPGSNHFSLLGFFKNYNQYSFYWYIEDDVYYNGEWSVFLDHFELDLKSDLISSYVVNFEEQPGWSWWGAIHYLRGSIPDEVKVRSFNPIYRISNRALNFLDQKLLRGWVGHHEVLIPTLLKLGRFEIKDFGGKGAYVPPGCTNKFYRRDDASIVNDTMRYRPKIHIDEIREQLLYHPVKTYR